jgi:iron-sulfur cluster assembly accessory protein
LSGDLIAEAEGVRVFLDAASAELLHGAELDFCDDLVGTGFRLQNPNAARSCGCGTSFEPASLPNAEQPSGEVSKAALDR